MDQVLRALGKLMGSFLWAKFFSKRSRFSASLRRSSCSYIIRPKTSTSSLSDNHSIPGRRVMSPAKKLMIARSRLIVFSTWG